MMQSISGIYPRRLQPVALATEEVLASPKMGRMSMDASSCSTEPAAAARNAPEIWT